MRGGLLVDLKLFYFHFLFFVCLGSFPLFSLFFSSFFSFFLFSSYFIDGRGEIGFIGIMEKKEGWDGFVFVSCFIGSEIFISFSERLDIMGTTGKTRDKWYFFFPEFPGFPFSFWKIWKSWDSWKKRGLEWYSFPDLPAFPLISGFPSSLWENGKPRDSREKGGLNGLVFSRVPLIRIFLHKGGKTQKEASFSQSFRLFQFFSSRQEDIRNYEQKKGG